MVRRSRSLTRVVVAAGLWLVGRGAVAGEQLDVADLVQGSQAIAIVTHHPGPKQSVEVSRWIAPPPAEIDPSTVSTTSALCVPDVAMLQRWLASHPHHTGRPTWQAMITALNDKGAAAHDVEQLVFFRPRNGALQPWCETEVMLGWGFSTHPAYAAKVQETEAAWAKKTGAHAAPASTPAPAPPPASAPTPASATTPDSPTSSGCW